VANNDNETKNAVKSTTISMAMAMQAAVRRGAHRPMEHIQGFTRSHWMPPLGKCLRRIAPTAAMLDEFE
jgi:hypothetical protein